MANKFFSATLLFLVTVSCTVVDEVVEYSFDYINFVAHTTRAISSDVTTLEGDADGFVVYGAVKGEDGWHDNLDGNNYIYNEESKVWGWKSDEAPTWPVPFYQINFYAYHPASAAGFTPSNAAPSSIVGDIVAQPSILDQTDYLASRSGDVVLKPTGGMQPLDFFHIMSKISFSVMQDEGILTVIRQLGIENVISSGSYDYVNSQWNELSHTTIGSFSDYVGSAGPFAKFGVTDQVDPIRIDGHHLMLIPQTSGSEDNQTPIWDGSVTIDDSGDLVPQGAYVSARYRTNSAAADLIGYAFRETCPNDTEWAEGSYFHSVYKKVGGSYNGPLYVKVGFKFTAEQLNWQSGREYDYTLPLHKTGGVYLSEYYYDVGGTNTKIKVTGSPDLGDPVTDSDISLEVTVKEWSNSEEDL